MDATPYCETLITISGMKIAYVCLLKEEQFLNFEVESSCLINFWVFLRATQNSKIYGKYAH